MADKAQVEILALQPAERALIKAYPLTVFLNGMLVGSSALHLANLWFSYYRGGWSQFFLSLIASAVGIGIFVWFGSALTQLRRATLKFIAICYVVFATIQALGAVACIALMQPIAALITAFFFYFSWLIASGFWLMATLSERERLLLRAPYARMMSVQAIKNYSGIPPILDFMTQKRLRAYGLTLLSSFCFSVAWLCLMLVPLIVLQVAAAGASVLTQGGLLLVTVIAISLFVLIANLLLNAARSVVRLSIQQLTATDPRRPILFLRAFYDDQIALKEPRHTWLGKVLSLGIRSQPLDHLLLDEGTPYGPVVALGNPDDRLPPYGAARDYFDNKNWQLAVADLASDALAIVLCLDETDSVWWEVEHVIASNQLNKTLFILPPKFGRQTENIAIATRLLQSLSVADDTLRTKLEPDIGQGGVIGIFIDENGTPKIGKSSSFTRLAYLSLLRWYFRGRFHAEIQATPLRQRSADIRQHP